MKNGKPASVLSEIYWSSLNRQIALEQLTLRLLKIRSPDFLVCYVQTMIRLKGKRNFHRAALLEYSSSVRHVFDFDDKEDTDKIQQAIKNKSYMGQLTCTATALREAENMLNVNRGMRIASDVKQEVLILTHGRSNCGGNATLAARRLQLKADVYVLMIGNYTAEGEAELQSYVSVPHNKHLFAIDGYQVLKKLLDVMEFEIGHPYNLPCVPFDTTK